MAKKGYVKASQKPKKKAPSVKGTVNAIKKRNQMLRDL